MIRSLTLLLAASCALASPAADGLWLDVPFVRQAPNGCGPACVAMVLGYWETARSDGSKPAGETIVPALSARALARGTSARDMEQALREKGFRVFAFGGEWRDLAEHLSRGRPLIVAIKEAGRFHYMVVSGVGPETVLVNDPARRKLLKLDRSRFEKSWSETGNWTLLALP